MFQRIEHRLENWAAGVAIIGGCGLLFATLITVVSILLKMIRRGLDAMLGSYFPDTPWAFIRPILGEEELVTYGVALALFGALPWVMIRKGHIRVDLFEPQFGDRFNRVLDLLGDIALTVIAYLIFTRQWFLIFKPARRSQDPMLTELWNGNWDVISARLRDSQESQILGLPLWPTYIVAEVCVFLFLLTAMFCVIRSTRALVSGR